MEPRDEKFDEVTALRALIADSEKARDEGRWMTQDQLEKLLHEKFCL